MTDQTATTDASASAQPATIESLDSIFKDEPAESQPDKQVADKDESKAGDADKGDDKGDKQASEASADKADEEEGKETATPADEEKGSVPYKAYKTEKRKRQELEEELAAERAKNVQQQEEDAPDPVEDPEGYEKHLRTKWEREQLTNKITSSRKAALDKHDDYEKMEKTFMYLASMEPALVKQMNAHADPAQFAYDKAKEHHGAIRAEILAEIESEKGAAKTGDKKADKATEKKAQAVAMPDLTKAAAQGSNSEAPPKLSDLSDIMEGAL
jgi:hypothetical protein